MKRVLNVLSLFTSVSTLLCCALPALLVAVGMGAAMAGFLSKYPQLIWLSENKLSLFVAGALLLGIGGFLQFWATPAECPIDKKEICNETKGFSRIIYIVSLVIYFIGLSFAYVIPLFL